MNVSEATAIYAAADPLARSAYSSSFWQMSRDDYDELRALAYLAAGTDDPEPDPEKRIPQPGDTLFGLPIRVGDVHGARIVTPGTASQATRAATATM